MHAEAAANLAAVCVAAADTGSGVSERIKQRLFEPFITTKGDAGTGLGLWVCDDIVKRHGGKLRLRSRTTGNSGTVFSIFLSAGVPPSSQISAPLTPDRATHIDPAPQFGRPESDLP